MMNSLQDRISAILERIFLNVVDRSFLKILEDDWRKGNSDKDKHRAILREHANEEDLIDLWKHAFDLIPLMGGLTFEDYLFDLIEDLFDELGIDSDEDERLKYHGYPD